MALIALIGSEIEGALNNYVGANVSTLMGWLLPMTITAGTLWIFMFGLAVKRGDVTEPVSVFIGKMAKNMLIVGLATTATLYQDLVVSSYNSATLGLVQLFQIAGSGMASATNSWGALDAFNTRASELVGDVWNELSFGKDMFGGIVAIALFSCGNAAFILAAFVVTLVTTSLSKFLLIVGPIFILLGLFESTRRFTHNWIGALAGLIVVSAVAFFCLGLSLFLNTKIVDAAHTGVGTIDLLGESAVYFAIVAGLGLVMWQSPGFASGLTGGAPTQMGIAMFTQVMTMLRSGGRGNTPPKEPPPNAVNRGPSRAYQAGDALGRATGFQHLYQRVAANHRG
ncbi:type IV secretion system protein [Azohydromonas lata]|uniref:type IV secretion system protein n=1 Tax=Azohydromonas lata TaxID=45677 RepID=UPI00082DB5FF|nr:type IV secretion system protein [Azohydromonas lata]